MPYDRISDLPEPVKNVLPRKQLKSGGPPSTLLRKQETAKNRRRELPGARSSRRWEKRAERHLGKNEGEKEARAFF